VPWPIRRNLPNEKLAINVRLTALAAAPGGLPEIDSSLFAFLRSQLDLDLPAAPRSLAAEVLGHAHLKIEQLIDLAQAFRWVGPLELDRLLEAFGQCSEEKVGQELLTALLAARARTSLRIDTLKPLLAKYPAPVRQRAKELYAALEADNAQQHAKLEQLLTSLKKGDVRRGQAVFNSAKASCASCHAIGYLGGNIGPDLTHIGKIRSERDLLESIVFPSASFVRSYEPMLVTTKDGKAHNGVIRKDAPDEIVLATGINQEVRIARKDIEDIQPVWTSNFPPRTWPTWWRSSRRANENGKHRKSWAPQWPRTVTSPIM
jgi:putative heme-binding domain-containing protein